MAALSFPTPASSHIWTIRFASSRLLIDFIETSEPAQTDAGRWSELMRNGR